MRVLHVGHLLQGRHGGFVEHYAADSLRAVLVDSVVFGCGADPTEQQERERDDRQRRRNTAKRPVRVHDA